MKAKKGDSVQVDYEGTLDSGEVFDSSAGKAPITFTIGEGHVIKGFENAVDGMEVGQEKAIDILPEEGYGKEDERLRQEVPRKEFPEALALEEGKFLQLRGPEGNAIFARIEKIGAENVSLNFNHPLAGKKLHFKLTLVKIG